MSAWNPNRNPDKYLASWHKLLRRPPGRYALARAEDAKEARKLQNRFNAFKASLRNHPLHPTAQELSRRSARVTVEDLTATELGGFCLWVETRWADSFTDSLLEALHNPPPA